MSCAIYFTYACRKRLPTQRPICKTEQQRRKCLSGQNFLRLSRYLTSAKKRACRNIWNTIVPFHGWIENHWTQKKKKTAEASDRMIDEQVPGHARSPHLPFREIQVYGDFVPPESGQIVVMGEFCLQFSNLLFGECCPLLPWLAAHIRFVIPILGLLKEKTRMEVNITNSQKWSRKLSKSSINETKWALKHNQFTSMQSFQLNTITAGLKSQKCHKGKQEENKEYCQSYFTMLQLRMPAVCKSQPWVFINRYIDSHNELALTITLSEDFIWLTVNGIRYPCSFNMEQNSTGGCVKIYFLSLFTSKFYERLPLMARELPAHNSFQWSVSHSLPRSCAVNYGELLPPVSDVFLSDRTWTHKSAYIQLHVVVARTQLCLVYSWMGNAKGQWGNVKLASLSILLKTHALLLLLHTRKEILFRLYGGFKLLWVTCKGLIKLLGSFIYGCGASANPTSNPKPSCK